MSHNASTAKKGLDLRSEAELIMSTPKNPCVGWCLTVRFYVILIRFRAISYLSRITASSLVSPKSRNCSGLCDGKGLPSIKFCTRFVSQQQKVEFLMNAQQPGNLLFCGWNKEQVKAKGDVKWQTCPSFEMLPLCSCKDYKTLAD